MIIYPGEYDSYPEFDIIKIPGFRKGHGPRQIIIKGDILLMFSKQKQIINIKDIIMLNAKFLQKTYKIKNDSRCSFW